MLEFTKTKTSGTCGLRISCLEIYKINNVDRAPTTRKEHSTWKSLAKYTVPQMFGENLDGRQIQNRKALRREQGRKHT